MKHLHLSKYVGELVLVLLIIIGFNSYTEYGMAWDEPQQRLTGLVSYDYVFTNNNNLHAWQDRDYGVGIELPLIFIEKALGLETTREIFQVRHLFTHLLFLFSAFVFYKLNLLIFKSRWLALFGFLLLVTQPLLYGHSFFNSKDLPFLSIFICALFLTAKLFESKKIIHALILGICIGVLLNIRLMGIMVPMLVIFFLLIDSIFQGSIKKHLLLSFIVSFTSVLTLVITWPFLWNAPIDNFQFAFENMSNFRFNREMLFMGQLIKPTEIKWNYIPIWFSITNPVIYLFSGIAGFIAFFYSFAKNPFRFILPTYDRIVFFAVIFFIVPLAAVIYLDSVLYDSWRQMFFIYPPFVLLIVFALQQARQKSKAFFMGVSGLLIMSLFSSGFFIYSNFPLGHTYFNEVITLQKPNYAIQKFENDYWGVSYKQGFEYILKHDDSKNINLAVQNMPGYLNEDMLSEEGENRIHMKNINEADYFLTEFRFHSFAPDSLEDKKFHTIKIANSTVLQIYKLK